MGVERGYNIDLFKAEYNQVERQLLDPTSDLYQFNSDFIVIFQSTHKLPKEDMLRLYLSKADNYYITAQQSKPVVVKDGKTERQRLRN